MRGDRIGKLRWIINLINGNKDFRRNLAVQLNILIELANNGARNRVEFRSVARKLFNRLSKSLEKSAFSVKRTTFARWPPSTNTLTVPSGSLRS